MGLIISISVVCDKDLTTTIQLDNANSPLPEGWLRTQGYANISGGASESVDGYFCPVCVETYGTRDLVKTAADASLELTDVQADAPVIE